MKRAFLAASFMALTLPLAQADECADAQDQATMAACAEQAYRASDAELNALYHEIAQRLRDDGDTRRLLRDAERSWLAFRDAECGFAASAVEGGSAYPMVHAMCLDSLTKERIARLQQYLECEEGSLSCPVPAQ